MKLLEAATEEIAMETNAAYRLKAKDHDHVHSPEEHIIAEAVFEKVTMETNAAYWFSTENQLQTLVEQVNMESITKCEVNHELQENPAKQVTDSAHYFNSDPQSPCMHY